MQTVVLDKVRAGITADDVRQALGAFRGKSTVTADVLCTNITVALYK